MPRGGCRCSRWENVSSLTTVWGVRIMDEVLLDAFGPDDFVHLTAAASSRIPTRPSPRSAGVRRSPATRPSGTCLPLHAAVSAVLRDRALGRICRDPQPASYLEPLNLLDRNQTTENEPPEHTRLRRPVAGAFNRGHVERLRPRPQAPRPVCSPRSTRRRSTSSGVRRAAAGPGDRCSGRARQADVSTLRRWSQAIVRMYEPSPSAGGRRWRCAPRPVRRPRPRASRPTPVSPADDLTSDLLAAGLSEDEQAAAVVLLLTAGDEASVHVFGNGLVALLSRELRPRDDAGADRRGDAAVRLRAAALRAHAVLPDVEVGDVTVAAEENGSAALVAAPNRDLAASPEVALRDAGRTVRRNRDPASGGALHLCLPRRGWMVCLVAGGAVSAPRTRACGPAASRSSGNVRAAGFLRNRSVELG